MKATRDLRSRLRKRINFFKVSQSRLEEKCIDGLIGNISCNLCIISLRRTFNGNDIV